MHASAGLLQLMGAAETGRDLAYFTFGDRVFVQELNRVHSELIAAKCDVGKQSFFVRFHSTLCSR